MSSPSNLRAILAMVVAMGMFVTSDSCMKLALADAPLGQLMLMRGIASVLICLSLIAALGQAHHLQRMFNGWLVGRGLLEVVANVSFTLGLGFIAIADLVAIAQTAPLFVLLGAWAFRSEEPGRMRLTLILFGLAGALLVAQPGGGASSFYAMLAFLCPMAAATRDLITPRAPRGRRLKPRLRALAARRPRRPRMNQRASTAASRRVKRGFLSMRTGGRSRLRRPSRA